MLFECVSPVKMHAHQTLWTNSSRLWGCTSISHVLSYSSRRETLWRQLVRGQSVRLKALISSRKWVQNKVCLQLIWEFETGKVGVLKLSLKTCLVLFVLTWMIPPQIMWLVKQRCAITFLSNAKKANNTHHSETVYCLMVISTLINLFASVFQMTVPQCFWRTMTLEKHLNRSPQPSPIQCITSLYLRPLDH